MTLKLGRRKPYLCYCPCHGTEHPRFTCEVAGFTACTACQPRHTLLFLNDVVCAHCVTAPNEIIQERDELAKLKAEAERLRARNNDHEDDGN